MYVTNSAGVFTTGSTPYPRNFSAMSGCFMTETISPWMRVTISLGVPAGTITPFHEVASTRKLDATLKASIKTQLIGTAKQKKISSWLNGVKSGLSKKISYAKGYAPTATTTAASSTASTS